MEARRPGDDSRSSVWDVLAHPNGWVYYTTYFEEMGRARPGMDNVEHFDSLGTGLNEIAMGPGGNLYVTRYGGSGGDGSVVMISQEGELLREQTVHALDGAVTAPKSIAVDPVSGDVWLNADVIAPDKSVHFAWFHLGPDLKPISHGDSPELMFPAFDKTGRGFFVEDDGGRVRVRVTRGGKELARLDLGPRAPHDFAQDVHFAKDGTAAIAFWSGRVELVREKDGQFSQSRVAMSRDAECASNPNALFYSAFVEPKGVYATYYCDQAIARVPLSAEVPESLGSE
jgi:hypothetical protein